jgi:hypothetical protein
MIKICTSGAVDVPITCSTRMVATKRCVRGSVLQRLSERDLQSIMTFVRLKAPALQGLRKPKTFVGDCVLVALYKDLFGLSYQSVWQDVKLWHPIAMKTIAHNTQLLRGLFALWGKQRVQLGTLPEWREAVEDAQFPKDMAGVCLWMDSKDFRLIGKASTSMKSHDWSYKCNSPGRRYMCLMDGEGKVLQLWGGYSPKVRDSDFLELNQQWLEEHLAGASVIADSHFDWGVSNLEAVKFEVSIPKPRGRRKKGPGGIKIPKQLTQVEEKYNKHHHTVRARVENAFGRMAAKVTALTKPFRDGKKQLDYLVMLAAALINSD